MDTQTISDFATPKVAGGMETETVQARQDKPIRRRLRYCGGRIDDSDGLREVGTGKVDIGRQLCQMRIRNHLSIRALAEMSEISVNTLSLIENGKTSPSVSTLQRLSVALRIPITAFFEVDTSGHDVSYIQARQRPRAQFAHGLLEDLGAGMVDRTVQPFLVTLDPNSGSGSQPVVHTGHEFVYCLSGRITYMVDGQVYLLEPGDSLLFQSHLPHQWHNIEAEPSQALLVLCPSDRLDRPTDRHFALIKYDTE